MFEDPVDFPSASYFDYAFEFPSSSNHELNILHLDTVASLFPQPKCHVLNFPRLITRSQVPSEGRM